MSTERKIKLIIPELIKWLESGSNVVVDTFKSYQSRNTFDLFIIAINDIRELEIIGKNGISCSLKILDIKDIWVIGDICQIRLKNDKKANIFITKMPIAA